MDRFKIEGTATAELRGVIAGDAARWLQGGDGVSVRALHVLCACAGCAPPGEARLPVVASVDAVLAAASGGRGRMGNAGDMEAAGKGVADDGGSAGGGGGVNEAEEPAGGGGRDSMLRGAERSRGAGLAVPVGIRLNGKPPPGPGVVVAATMCKGEGAARAGAASMAPPATDASCFAVLGNDDGATETAPMGVVDGDRHARADADATDASAASSANVSPSASWGAPAGREEPPSSLCHRLPAPAPPTGLLPRRLSPLLAAPPADSAPPPSVAVCTPPGATPPARCARSASRRVTYATLRASSYVPKQVKGIVTGKSSFPPSDAGQPCTSMRLLMTCTDSCTVVKLSRRALCR